MDSGLYCVDCKFHKLTNKVHLCWHEKNVEVSQIDGKKFTLRPCQELRMSPMRSECGRTGMNFIHKDD